jgi:hypothetical protein
VEVPVYKSICGIAVVGLIARGPAGEAAGQMPRGNQGSWGGAIAIGFRTGR